MTQPRSERASTGAHLELPDGRTASVVAQLGRTGWWLHVEAAGERLSGALWQRASLDEAIAAAPALLEHWRQTMTSVYGTLEAGVAASEEAYRG